MTFQFSLWCDVYLCFGDLDEKIYTIIKEIKSMIISILQNLSYVYSNHNSNIKCVDLI